MKKIFSKLLLGGAFLCGLSMSLTSCEGALDDILGEWSRPTPGGGSSSDETTPTMKATPLTLEAITAGTIVVNNPQTGMYYKKNGGDQVALTADASIDVTKDDKVEFYGTATNYAGTTFGGTADVKVYGNIMSLVDETGFEDNKTLTADYTFLNLFAGYANLKDASNLFLPAETLTEGCYALMFAYCTSLTTAPALPAETLTNSCYEGMFFDCTSLTTAPKLPAKSLALADNCYKQMFQGCTTLTTAPKLPATTLANLCYNGMFQGCTSLTAAPELKAMTLASECYRGMFAGCTSLTAAPALDAEPLANSCYRGMFQDCTSLTTAPKLPATTLVNFCYAYMFSGCTSLKDAYVKAAYKNTDDKECDYMFYGCTNDGTCTLYTDGDWSSCTDISNWTKNTYPTE